MGLAIVGGAWVSLIHTLVVPRGGRSKLAASIANANRAFFHTLARRRSTFEGKDRVLAAQGPVALLVILATWLLMFLTGFALVLWPLTDGPLLEAVRESGSSMFTLGFAQPTDALPTAIAFFTAFTGLVVIALQIAYLPVLYSAFNRRETMVTTLESRAGAPAWGPEVLARHQTVGILDNLPEFYAEWERWAAEVTESHTTYPVLISFRSPHALRHWVVGLLAVLDSAALYNALCPQTVPSEARLFLRMGFTALRNIADTAGISYDPDPLPDGPVALTYEEFVAGIERLELVGFPMERSPEEAWPHFRGWRVNYEAIAYQLADRLLAVPGPWSGPRSGAPGIRIEPKPPRDRRPDDPTGQYGGPLTWRER